MASTTTGPAGVGPVRGTDRSGGQMNEYGGGDRKRDLVTGAVSPEALLRTLIDLGDDAVILCDAASTVTFFSETGERLFGRRAPDVMGGPVAVLFPEHLSDEMEEVFASVAAGERIRHFETEIVRPDGLPTPVSLSLSPLADDRGAMVGWVMVARDVTEQHLAQATLAEIDARLEEGEALSHIGSWLWDLRTGAVQWSAEFHRIHGIDPLDFAGTFESYMALIAPDDRDRVKDSLTQSVHGTRPLDLEYRVVDADGKTHVVRVHGRPTRGSDGNAVGLRGIGQDVTDRADPPAGGH